jgi:hypothetical protein
MKASRAQSGYTMFTGIDDYPDGGFLSGFSVNNWQAIPE